MSSFYKATKLLLILAAAAAIPSPCLAQASIYARLQGVVQDSSGAVIPSAALTLTNDATGIPQHATADAAGRYIFNELRPATYTIAVEAQGFKTLVRNNIVLRVAQQTSLDLQVEVGEISTKVEVQGTAPLLNSASAALGQEIDNKYVVNVPLFNRTLTSLAFLAPGVTEVPGGSASATNFVANGQRNATAEARVDSISVTAPQMGEGGNLAMQYTPSPEIVQEFKIQTNSFSAEYGNNGGTVINMVTKSGTNEFHGAGYWFGRRPEMDANGFYANRAGKPKGDYARDQYGAVLSGPVRKQRTFFLFGYEKRRDSSPKTLTKTVPTALERQGDFSQTKNSNGTLQAIYNPMDTFLDAGKWKRRPFAGNVIPKNLLDPIGAKLASFFPNPTGAGDGAAGTNNFTAVDVQRKPQYTYDLKLDQQFSEKSRLSARYSFIDTHQYAPTYFKTVADDTFENIGRQRTAYLEHTYLLSPNTVWTVRGGLVRVWTTTRPPEFDVTSIGLPAILKQGGANEFPAVETSGFAFMGTAGWRDLLSTITQYQYGTVLAKVVGGHNIRIGGEQTLPYMNYWQPGYPAGQFRFDRSRTTELVVSPKSGQGNAVASMLLGWTGGTGTLDVAPPNTNRSKETSLFVQDDWRVSSRLTVNAGIRYEWSSPYTDRWDRIQVQDPAFDTGIDLAGVGRLRGRARFVTSDARTLPPDRNNVAPRLGFALRLDQKTVLRAGAGVYYGVNGYTNTGTLPSSFRSSTALRGTLDGGVTRYATLSNPFPTGLKMPAGRAYGDLANWGFTSEGNMGSEFRNPEIYQWNAGLQRELPSNVLVEFAYSASRSTHLPFAGTEDLNVVSRQNREKWGSDGLEEMVANPFQPFFQGPNAKFNEPTSIYNNATLQRVNLLRPYPQFEAFVGVPEPRATARYDSFLVRFEKRYSHGINFVGHYTYSKMYDNASAGFNSYLGNSRAVQDRSDLRSEWSVAASDTPHRFVLAATYELPFGKGRPVGSSWARPIDAVLGGWQVNGLVTFQAGPPLGFGLELAELADGTQRPNLAGNPRGGASIKDGVDGKANYFNASAFSQPDPQMPGNTPRFVSEARGSGIRNVDFSLFKQLTVKEAKKLELRAEFFNFTNTPRFGSPNTTVGNSAFGTFSAQSNTPRQAQMGARFVF